MNALRQAVDVLIAWFVAAGAIVAVGLLAVGVLGVALACGLAMVWEWLEDRNCGY